MTASRMLDAVSLLPGCSAQQSDAPQAYTQCEFGTGFENLADTWVELPKNQWPKEWHGKYYDPVVPLVLALYGHPLSGTFWENYHSNIALKVGFEKILGWECLYVHRPLKVVLSVYVDDFKLAGLTRSLPIAWKALTDGGLELDKPEPLGLYLGCNQHPVTMSQSDVDSRLENIRPLYPRVGAGPPEQTLSKLDKIWDVASSEDLNDMNELFVGEPSPAKKFVPKSGIKGTRYEMEGFCDQCVESYCELAGVDQSAVRPKTALLFSRDRRSAIKRRQFYDCRQSGGGRVLHKW